MGLLRGFDHRRVGGAALFYQPAIPAFTVDGGHFLRAPDRGATLYNLLVGSCVQIPTYVAVMKAVIVDNVTLVLKLTSPTGDGLSSPDIRVDVPLHSDAHLTDMDAFEAIGFPQGTEYIRISEAVTCIFPLNLLSTCEWFEQAFSDEGYLRQMTTGRFGDIEWATIDVSLMAIPQLIVQMTLRSCDDKTLVTYRARERATSTRDPDSYIPSSVSRIDIEYSFDNGPNRKVLRTITSPYSINRICDALNSMPTDNRTWTYGLLDDRRAEMWLHFVDGGVRNVHVDPAHSSVTITGSPALFGSIWPLLIEPAPPDHRAGSL